MINDIIRQIKESEQKAKDIIATSKKESSEIIEKAKEMEEAYSEKILGVHPIYRKSAQNLVHYLAFRTFEIDDLQQQLRDQSLPSLSSIEAHVMDSLLSIKTIINHLLKDQTVESMIDTKCE